jgi:hypothetical protein
MPVEDARAMVQDWMALFPTAADARVLPAAIELRTEHGFAFWGAMLVNG